MNGQKLSHSSYNLLFIFSFQKREDAEGNTTKTSCVHLHLLNWKQVTIHLHCAFVILTPGKTLFQQVGLGRLWRAPVA